MNRILLCLFCITATTTAAELPKNIILILADDLGWADTTLYGKTSLYETPNIDQFAEEGVKFTNACAACHVCSPTRFSILTGKYPARNNMTDWIPGRRDFDFKKYLNVRTTRCSCLT